MADLRRIQETIVELSRKRKNVELSEIAWVVNQLGQNGFKASVRNNDHAAIFTINGHRFSVCSHHKGSKQVRRCYVDEFLGVMEELGLYEE